MPIRTFEYGLLNPIKNAELVDEQIFRMHVYRNKLVEIERERRTKAREALSSHVDVEPLQQRFTALLEQRDQLREQLNKARALARKRNVGGDLPAQIKAMSQPIKDLYAEIKTAKQAIASDPAIKEALSTIEEHARQRVRDERAKCGCYWSNYLLVEAAADAARASKAEPKFMRWDHGELSYRQPDGTIGFRDRGDEGRVSVQLQGGLDLDELWGKDTQLQIDPVSEIAFDPHTRRGDRRRAQRTRVRMRVGSDGRKPIWAEWPMILHRPLPAGARIKVATISRRRRNIRQWFWRLHLQVELPDGWAKPPATDHACAINLGWCKHPSGLRVGYVTGTDGQETEIVLPKSIIHRVEKSESIRSIRDKNLDVMRPLLAEKLHELATANKIPEWLAARGKAIALWRSPIRFARLATKWRFNRFDGDAEAYDLIEAWRYRDEHLHKYEAGLMQGALGYRREIYRLIAAELSAKYKTLVIDDTKLDEFQRSPNPEEKDGEIAIVKRRQRHAAAHLLRQIFVSAFKRAGAVSIEPVEATRCQACGSVEKWDRISPERWHTCSQCGEGWDQDANACVGLLKAYRERLGVDTGAEDARGENAKQSKPSRSDRLRGARLGRSKQGPLADGDATP